MLVWSWVEVGHNVIQSSESSSFDVLGQLSRLHVLSSAMLIEELTTCCDEGEALGS